MPLCSYNVVENEAHSCVGVFSIRDEFPPIFENVVLGSLKSFSQAPITPNFPLGSNREIVGDFVEK
jgi:hypothetical protein